MKILTTRQLQVLLPIVEEALQVETRPDVKASLAITIEKLRANLEGRLVDDRGRIARQQQQRKAQGVNTHAENN